MPAHVASVYAVDVRSSSSVGDCLPSETHLGLKRVRDRGRCVLLSPNRYHVGMSSLAVHTLYGLLNAGGLICERAFLPDDAPGKTLRSLESRTPLAGFDFVLITSSFELDWLNIPAMLEAGGVPPLRQDREARHPLVIAGGPAVTMNPEPLADLVDACVIGEIEPIASEFTAALAESGSREEVIERLEALPGVYVPAKPEYAPELGPDRARVGRLYAPDLDEVLTESVVLTPHTEFSNRFLIEVGRGCGRSCRFCLARQIYHPTRARKPATLLGRIDKALQHTRRMGLVGAAISDYPWTEELFAGLRERKAEVSVSSVRAESVSEGLLAVLGASGQETLTIAPETGTEELRRSIGKGTSDEDIVRCIKLGLVAGLPRYKLYFMVGLPGETEEDAAAIPGLIAQLRRRVPAATLSISVSPFVPKPHTPFENVSMLPESVLGRRLESVSAELHRAGIHDLTCGSARWSAAQAVLARGGRELGSALVEASLAGGGLSALKSAVRRTGRKWREYLDAQEFESGDAPWDVVGIGDRG